MAVDCFAHDVDVVGGCGHVGLPLAVALADRGASVLVYAVSEYAVGLVNEGLLPFAEPGADDVLKSVVSPGAHVHGDSAVSTNPPEQTQ